MNKILTIKTELDIGARVWIAEIEELPGTHYASSSKEEAIRDVKILALRVLAEQLEHQELDDSLAGIIFTVED